MAPAGGAGSVQFRVDLDQLHTLRSRMNDIRRDLLDVHVKDGNLGAASETGGGIATYGDAGVVRAVNAFVENWRHGREIVGDELNDIVVAIQYAIDTYSGAESSLSQY